MATQEMATLVVYAIRGGGVRVWIAAGGAWHVEQLGIFPDFAPTAYGSGTTLQRALDAMEPINHDKDEPEEDSDGQGAV